MTFLKRIFLVCVLAIFTCNVFSQINDSAINIVLIKANYSIHTPSGDLSKRFGLSHTIGFAAENKFKNNLSLGVNFNYLFGNTVNDTSILDHLKDKYSGIINKHGEYGTILLTERGFYIGGFVGKVIPVLAPNPNSGIKLEFGAGLLQHHIRIENKDNNIPAVLDDYKKGYDRLHNGLSLRQFIGYQYMHPKRKFNFYAGFEFYQAWTQNRRSLNYDTGLKDTVLKHDYLWGFNLGMIIPIYRQAPKEYYYF